MCFFTRGIYYHDVVSRALATAGWDCSADDLDRIGRMIHAEEYAMKFRDGFSLDNLRIPKPILETVSPARGWDEAFLRQTIAQFGRLLQGQPAASAGAG